MTKPLLVKKKINILFIPINYPYVLWTHMYYVQMRDLFFSTLNIEHLNHIPQLRWSWGQFSKLPPVIFIQIESALLGECDLCMTLTTSSLSFCHYGNIITEQYLCLTGVVWTETERYSGDYGWGEGKRETDARVCQSTPWDPIKLNHTALTGKHEYSANQLMHLCPPEF